MSENMDVVVVSRHTETPADLRDTAEEKVARFTRFANDIRRVEVDFDETHNQRVAKPHRCEILVHLTGHLVKGHGEAADPAGALDAAIDRVELQMRRLHSRRATRRGSRRDGGPGRAATRDAGADAASGAFGPGTDRAPSDDDGDEAMIVKEKRFLVKPMSAEEAALQMELLGHDFYLFTSSENGQAAVIYRRNDGNLGLIEAGP